MPVFEADQLKEIVASIFEACGTPKEEAKIVAEHIVTANLYGIDSHGIIRVLPYLSAIADGRIKPGAAIRVAKETSSVAVVDGNFNFGQVAGREAMRIAIQKARSTGIGMTTLYNVFHTGRVGEYAEMAIREDMIGIVFGGGRPQSQVAAYGGTSPVLCTNPISIGIPTLDERPFLLDMATSIVSAGKVSLYSARGQRVPEGWIVNSEGKPTTDPEDFRPPLTEYERFVGEGKKMKRGSLLTFGEYKGFGLSVFVEILGGLLAESGMDRSFSGFIFIAIDISRFKPVDEFKGNVDLIIRRIKDSRKSPDVKGILIAGEPEFNSKDRRLKEGIPVEDKTWNEIEETIKRLKLNLKDK